MREKQVENYLIEQWERVTGGMCIKFPPLYYAGFPDRICIARPGLIIFVETKAPFKFAKNLQRKVHARLRDFGFRVECLSTHEEIDGFMLSL